MSGVYPCGCRDCMENTYGGLGELCWECEEADCTPCPSHDRCLAGLYHGCEVER